MRLSSLCGAALLAIVIASLRSLLRSSTRFAVLAVSLCSAHHCSFVIAAQPPELTVLRQQYDKVVAERVTAPYDAGLAELNTKYTAGLDRAIADAKAAGKLEDILAIEAEKKRLADKLPIPATDDAAEPEALKKYRAIYRQQHAAIEATRDKTHADLLPPYTAKLKDLEAVLVKNDRVDEAKEVLTYRQGLSTSAPAAPSPAVAATPTTPQPPASLPTADVPKVKGDDRKAAEWILANWSEHRLFADSKLIKSANELPKGKFAVTGFSLDGRFYTGKEALNQAVLMEHLGGLIEVRTMTIYNFPNLKDEDFAFISTLTGLDELRLGKLACTDAVLAWIKDLKKLQKVYFSELPNFTGSGLSLLASLALDEVQVWKTAMDDAGVEVLAGFKNLQKLNLESHLKITDASLNHLSKLPALKALYISATGMTPDGLAAVTFPKVDSLGCNALKGFTLKQIAPKAAIAFPKVTGFQISHDISTSEDLAALAYFKNLERLSNYGMIAEASWPGLLELRELKSFDQNTAEPVPDAAWKVLAKLKKLKAVRYGTKPPNEAALAAFKKQRPDVKVEP